MLMVLGDRKMLTRYFATVTIFLTATTFCGCTICIYGDKNGISKEDEQRQEQTRLEQGKPDAQSQQGHL